MLKVKNVSKTYHGKNIEFAALNNVSFELPDSGFFAILGPSGCGKTTLLNIIGGMDSEFKGVISVDKKTIEGNCSQNLDEYRKETIGFIFQHAILLNSLTVMENVIFPLQISSQPKIVQNARATEILKLLNIYDLRNRKINTLSGGQKQRVVIARALINNPKIILSDEPTGELDTKNSKIILNILQKLAATRLIIMVTHEEKFAYQYAQKIIKMKDGEIQDIIDNSKNVEESNLNFELTPKVKKEGKSHLPYLTSLKIAFRSLGLHKFRNFLTSLGLSIGLTGVALSLALTNGFQSLITDTLLKIENENYAQIQQENPDFYKPIKSEDIEIISNAIEDEQLQIYTNYSYSTDIDADTPLLTTNNDEISNLHEFFNYHLISYNSKRITPTLSEPLQNDEILVSSRNFQVFCSMYDPENSMCSIQTISNTINQLKPVVNFTNTSHASIKNKQFKVVGLVDTTYIDNSYIDQTKLLYHTNKDFLSSFIQGSEFFVVENEEDIYSTTNSLFNHYYISYPDNANTALIMQNLNAKNELSQYYFFINPYYNDSFYISRPPYLRFTSTMVQQIVNENLSSTVGYAYGHNLQLNEGLLSFNKNIFISDDVNLAAEYAEKEDYKLMPLSDLPPNILNTFNGNVFTFRPLNSNNKVESSDYYNIIGSVPDYNSLDEIVISKGFADQLLKGKEKNYQSLVDKLLYGKICSVFGDYDAVSFNLKIVGVALNESKVVIMHDGYWTHAFFENKLSNNDKFDVSSYSLQTVYLFCKNNINVYDYIETLRTKYENYSISNDIIDFNKVVSEVIDVIRTSLIVLSSISVIVAVLLIGMVSFISIIERRQEVGVIRTMGAKKKDVVFLFLNETVFLGLLSTLLAYVSTFIFSLIINSIFNFTITVATLISTNISIAKINLEILLVVLASSITLSVLAGFLPSIKIATIDPIKALKKK